MIALKTYSSFVKAEHTLFSLPVILAGAFLAHGSVPSTDILILIVLAGVGARTSAMALNRIIDRKIDSLNPRTRERELPAGILSYRSSIFIAVAGAILYLVAAFMICPLVFYLSPVPLLVFIFYPLMKRFTPMCHFGVGLALGLAPLGGWLAVKCSLEDITGGLLLGLFAFFWVSGFDIIYATLDEKFDKKQGIFSLVAVYGRKMALKVSSICHILAFISLLMLFLYEFKSFVSMLLLAIIGYFLYLEHKKSENVDLAFFKINILIGALVFVFILSGIYLIH